jgi:hypothetical protein
MGCLGATKDFETQTKQMKIGLSEQVRVMEGCSNAVLSIRIKNTENLVPGDHKSEPVKVWAIHFGRK